MSAPENLQRRDEVVEIMMGTQIGLNMKGFQLAIYYCMVEHFGLKLNWVIKEPQESYGWWG